MIPPASKQLSPCTTTTEPVLWSWKPQLLQACTAAPEAHTPSNLCSTRKRGLCTATRETPCSNEDPEQPKIKKINQDTGTENKDTVGFLVFSHLRFIKNFWLWCKCGLICSCEKSCRDMFTLHPVPPVDRLSNNCSLGLPLGLG